MLQPSHDLFLVLASLAVSLMASFTGLSLTRGSMVRPLSERKRLVAMAAVALGGGIWSMHFVAMLGMRLPIAFYYDALTTLVSALVAILMAGLALLILHFPTRTPRTITAAGAVIGLGIPLMHYIGMSGIRLCLPVYTATGLALAIGASLVLGIGSVWIIYGARRHRNILFGTIALGASVVVVHFVAMAGTGFLPEASPGGPGPRLDNATLAMIVTLVAFLFCGAFLLTGVTFFSSAEASISAALPNPDAVPPPDASIPRRVQIPHETEGRIHFVESTSVAVLRAEGHYTLAYAGARKLLCPWSISEAEKRLTPAGFVRVHRSYLINPALVTGFERRKDNGVCLFETTESIGKVPVSRTRLGEVRAALGL